MLNAAQKHVGAKSENASMSQSQIEAMLADDEEAEAVSGNSTAGNDAGGEAEPVQAVAVSEADEDAAIADRLREGINADAQAAAEEAEQKEKQKKEKKQKEKKEKKPLDKAAIAKIFTAAAVVVALALGYCVCLFFFADVINTSNEEFAIRAANAVNGKAAPGTELYFYKAYVRNGAAADECMLYAVISSRKPDIPEKTDMYRVVINRETPNKINVYYTLDVNSPGYLEMVESGDLDKRITASNLKNYSDEIMQADKEIQINTPGWEKINCNKVNKGIIRPEETTAPKK